MWLPLYHVDPRLGFLGAGLLAAVTGRVHPPAARAKVRSVLLASLGDSFSSFFDAVGVVLLEPRRGLVARAAARAGPLHRLPHAAGAGVVPHPACGLSGLRDRVQAHLGRVLRGLRLQRGHPGARRRRDPAVPDQDRRCPSSSYPAVAAAFSIEFIFDLTIAVPVLAYAFSQGVFPKPPDFSKLPAFDLAFFASHPRFTLFLLTVLGIAVLAGFALLSARVRAFWARVRQGLTILSRPPALLPRGLARAVRGLAVPLRRVLVPAGGVQRRRVGAATCCSCSASTRSPRWCRSRPAARACSRRCWSRSSARGATVAAYSVGQQIAIAALTFGIGLASVIWIFQFRSFKEVIAAGPRAARGGEGRATADRGARATCPRARRSTAPALLAFLAHRAVAGRRGRRAVPARRCG